MPSNASMHTFSFLSNAVGLFSVLNGLIYIGFPRLMEILRKKEF